MRWGVSFMRSGGLYEMVVVMVLLICVMWISFSLVTASI